MKSFPEWYKELCSDVRWFEYTSMNHKGKNFKKAAEFVYAQLLADSRLQMREMSENRKHVYNKLGSMPFDFVAPSLQQEEKKEDKEWVPLTGEARAKKLAEFKAMVDSAPKAFTKKEKPFVRSEFESRMALEEHKRKANDARRKLFLDAYPDASEEEIQNYINKFSL